MNPYMPPPPALPFLFSFSLACLSLGLFFGLPGVRAGDVPANDPRSPDRHVGPAGGDVSVAPNAQLIHPAGQTLAYPGRPVDLLLVPGRPLAVIKNTRGISLLDTANWTLGPSLDYDREAGSMHGIAIAVVQGQTRIYATGSHNQLLEATLDDNNTLAWGRRIYLPGPAAPNDPVCDALGIAITRDAKTAYVCLSRNNSIGVVDLIDGKLQREIPVGRCPFGIVLSPDESRAYVSNFGGRAPADNARKGDSAGTDVAINARGIPSSGTISIVDLRTFEAVKQIDVGLHPSDLCLSKKGERLYVANGNSDSVSILSAPGGGVIQTLSIRPDARLPFGSIASAVTLSPDEKTLYCACAGNNALAVIELGQGGAPSHVIGYIPTGWFPGALACRDQSIYVANVKGQGSRDIDPRKNAWNSRRYLGSVTRVTVPAARDLAAYTQRVMDDARLPMALAALEQASGNVAPIPVPAHTGEPSTIQHVIYVIKENRTYDQVLGDLGRGNGEPRLTIYGRAVTPNFHALAEQFVLLDNYYCNGVISADGHAWATQGMVTDYVEKGFGGWVRGYDFGSDALGLAACDFIWDAALMHGLSFRNYGEFDSPEVLDRKASFFDLYRQWKQGGNIFYKPLFRPDAIAAYSAPGYPGWDLRICDQYRVDRFLGEFGDYEKSGQFPSLVIVYLPQDHTSGTSEAAPSPRAMVADNDLALGRLVDAVSHSKFWENTCIFVNEDDPQDGFDHVDGHRSICLAISPYSRRRETVSVFYNQTAVLHTVCRMLGLPPLNQMVALAPTMEDCFTNTRDMTPYTLCPAQVPLDEPNKSRSAMNAVEQKLADAAAQFDFSKPDQINDDVFNQILWIAARPGEPYPKAFAGAHAKGLAQLKLRLETPAKDRDD